MHKIGWSRVEYGAFCSPWAQFGHRHPLGEVRNLAIAGVERWCLDDLLASTKKSPYCKCNNLIQVVSLGYEVGAISENDSYVADRSKTVSIVTTKSRSEKIGIYVPCCFVTNCGYRSFLRRRRLYLRATTP